MQFFKIPCRDVVKLERGKVLVYITTTVCVYNMNLMANAHRMMIVNSKFEILIQWMPNYRMIDIILRWHKMMWIFGWHVHWYICDMYELWAKVLKGKYASILCQTFEYVRILLFILFRTKINVLDCGCLV